MQGLMRRRLDEDERERVASALREELLSHDDVAVAYLHGSILEATEHVGDVDVAVLLAEHPSPEDALRRELRLEDSLDRRVDLPVDLRILDRCPASFRSTVLRNGRLLLCRDEAARERLMTETLHEREDLRPHEARYRRETLASGT